MIFAGVDLGTSGIKVALVDEEGIPLSTAARRSPMDIPQPGWSQQDPDQWWKLTVECFDELAAAQPGLMARLGGMSLSGQMLGQVLLDGDNRPITPCILWNDQRALPECEDLLDRVPDIGWRTVGHPDPGLTAPKLLWLAKHHPEVLDQADVLMLPKDFVRLRLTGDRATEVSDAAGTMMLDCASGTWDDALLAAVGWDRARLPELLKSFDPAGQLLRPLCRRWGTPQTVVVAAGAGDNYSGALGVGASRPSHAALSIGTSGVLSAVDASFHPAPDKAILTTPHAAPETFLSMGVVMAATQALDWLAGLTGTDAARLASMAEACIHDGTANLPISRPSITGVRTPDNRPDTTAVFTGMTAGHGRAEIAYAVMEGVGMQFRAIFDAQLASGVPIDEIQAVGGGSQSSFWVGIIATLLNSEILVPENGNISACIGAAKLAQAATHPDEMSSILARKLPVRTRISPRHDLLSGLEERYSKHRALAF